MSWLSKLFKQHKPNSATLAKERLQVIVSHQRLKRSGPDFLPKLEKEITEVIAKYVEIGPEDVSVEFADSGERSVLELNITLPERKPQAEAAAQ